MQYILHVIQPFRNLIAIKSVSMHACAVIRTPTLSPRYQQSRGCTVHCGLVARGNRSMITRRAKGVLKLRSESLPHERAGQQWAAAAMCNPRPQCTLLKNCVHIVHVACVRGRGPHSSSLCYFMRRGSFYLVFKRLLETKRH